MECAALWDMDGTLVDTAELHFQAWQSLAAQIGKPFTRADFSATFGRRNPEIIRALFDPNATDSVTAELGEWKEVIYRSAAKRIGVTLLPGARELLHNLHRSGWRQAIASSAPRANLELVLELTATRDLFQSLVTAEDTERGKPDPQVFQIAAAKLGAPASHCVVFEDAIAGVQAAKAAGMHCVAVRFVGHHSDEALTAAGADRVVDSLAVIGADDVRRLLEPHD